MDHPAAPGDIGTTSLQELLRYLRGSEGALPAALWRPLLAARATVVPALLTLVERALADDQTDLGWALLHAVELLGALGNARAVAVLLCCLDQEHEFDLRVQQTAAALRRPMRRDAVLWRRCPGALRRRPRSPGARPQSYAPLPRANACSPRGSARWAGTRPGGVGVARSISSVLSPWSRVRGTAQLIQWCCTDACLDTLRRSGGSARRYCGVHLYVYLGHKRYAARR
jgi:hypothetical protein